jgi:HD-GYP domain-containing protein (c-di-GMP phosphodiesterase class II)
MVDAADRQKGLTKIRLCGAPVLRPLFTGLASVCRDKVCPIPDVQDHERWDGTGYPSGARGESVPLCGYIMGICDQYDALRSKRPYKPALDHDRVVEIISKGDGRTDPGHFYPALLSAFEAHASKFGEIFSAVS